MFHGSYALDKVLTLLQNEFPNNFRATHRNPDNYIIEFSGSALILQTLPTTCSTIYLGGIEAFLFENEDFKKAFWEKLTTWAKNKEAAGTGGHYSQFLCTVRSRISEDAENKLLALGFTKFGEPFTNRRTGNSLQHYSYKVETE